MTAILNIPEAGAGRNQAMRTALAMSVITGRPVHLSGLVDDRLQPRPGLGPGGTAVASALSRICNGQFNLLDEGRSLDFTPGQLQNAEYAFDVAKNRPSAFPLTLVALALLVPLARCGGEAQVFLAGATHVQEGPSSEELRLALFPMLADVGLTSRYIEIAPGFFPDGRGEAELNVRPAGVLDSLQAEDAFTPRQCGVTVLVSGLPVYLAEQALEGAVERLTLKGLSPKTDVRRARGGKGMAVTVWARGAHLVRTAFTTYGKQGGRPESLAVEAAEQLGTFMHSGAGLPASLAPHLLLPLACAQGVSRFTVTGNTGSLKATARVINAFWPGTMVIEHAKHTDLAGVRIVGRDWGKLAG